MHREIERALHRNEVIIPMRVQNIRPTGTMEYLLSTCQTIDAFGAEFDAALEQLTRRLPVAGSQGP